MLLSSAAESQSVRISESFVQLYFCALLCFKVDVPLKMGMNFSVVLALENFDYEQKKRIR